MKDRYEIYLDETTIKLKECQEKNSLDTCSKCDKFLECELRNEYVKAAYESMSKGKTGGFEF